MTAARRSAIALLLLAAGLVAVVLSPAGRPPAIGALAARAAVERTVVVAEKTTHTHTTHTHTQSTDSSPCPTRLIEILREDCIPTETPAPGPTFLFTNSAGQVSIPPTATPRPAPTATPTPLDTPFPADAATASPSADTTTTTTASTGVPASGGVRTGGGGVGVPLLAGVVILVLLGGTAGLVVLRLR